MRLRSDLFVFLIRSNQLPYCYILSVLSFSHWSAMPLGLFYWQWEKLVVGSFNRSSIKAPVFSLTSTPIFYHIYCSLLSKSPTGQFGYHLCSCPQCIFQTITSFVFLHHSTFFTFQLPEIFWNFLQQIVPPPPPTVVLVVMGLHQFNYFNGVLEGDFKHMCSVFVLVYLKVYSEMF